MTSLPLRAAFAVLAMPAIVAGYLPWRIGTAPERFPLAIGAGHWLGVPLAVLGLAIFSWTVRDFFVRGQGTLAPWDPPKFLVAEGSYRWSRNPMYVGVLLLIWGQGIWYRSGEVLLYGTVMALIFHLRVVLGEEPWLARTFPEPWAAYTMKVKRWGLFALLLSAAPLSAQMKHPTAENLAVTPTATIRRSDTLSGDVATDALARRLRALRPVGRIGGEEAVSGADWGRIADVAVDRGGRILVLDEQDKSISRWSPEGRAAGRFGRSGGGPLEFRSPTDLMISADGTLIVSDRAAGLRRFTWDAEPRPLSTWMPGKSFRDACVGPLGVIGSRANEDGTVAQVVGPDGERSRGVGARYKSSHEFVARVLSEGQVGCLPTGGIVTTNVILPYVWIWDRDGHSIAITQLPDFIAMGVEEVDNGVSYSTPATGYEFVRRIVPVGTDHFLVQLAYQSAASEKERAEYAELRSYLLSDRTGKGVYLGTSLPLIAGGVLPQLVGWRNDPVPEVVILR